MKYKIIRNIINEEFSLFLFTYFLIKRQVALTLKNDTSVNMDNIKHFLGTFGDKQIKDNYNCYSDICFETLLVVLKEKIELKIKKKLLPTYTYARMYETGAELKKHKDRKSCELSATLNLGGDPWPIFFKIKNTNKKIILKPGDLVFYRGCDITHWREPFKGEVCGQVFLHYVEDKELNYPYKFDRRMHLGLPSVKI